MNTEINELEVNGVKYVRKDSVKAPEPVGDAVIVRAYSGVFFGYLVKKEENSVELRNARQIWSWDSAGLTEKVNTCGDIALRGVGTGSKVSDTTPKAIIDQVGAVFFCTKAAVDVISSRKFGK